MKRINLMNAVNGLGVMPSDRVKLALLSEPQAHFGKDFTVSESIDMLKNHKENCMEHVKNAWNDIKKREHMTKEEKEKADDAWEYLHFTDVKNILFKKYMRDKKNNEREAKNVYESLKSRHDGYVKSNNNKRFLEFFSEILYTEFLYFFTIDRDLFTMNALKNGDAPTNDNERFFTKEYIASVRSKMEQEAYSLEDKVKIEVQRDWYIGRPSAQEQVEALQAENIPYEVIATLVYKKGVRGFGERTIGLLLCTDGGNKKDDTHYKRKTKQLIARADKCYNIKLV